MRTGIFEGIGPVPGRTGIFEGFRPVPARTLPRPGVGVLWMWLQRMCLLFEVVRGPVGVVWGRLGAGLGPLGPQIDPKRSRPDLGQPQIATT